MTPQMPRAAKKRASSWDEYAASEQSDADSTEGLVRVGSPGPPQASILVSAADVKFTGDSRDGFPSRVAFLQQMAEYLTNLNERKREKALMGQEMYDKCVVDSPSSLTSHSISAVLLDPKNTAVGTAQFRFWSKKMFKLVNIKGTWLVTHENHPVAVKEQIYDVLVHAHHTSAHGGRDKTSAQVRVWYSWIPKELIARFVKICPLCTVRRRSRQSTLTSLRLGARTTRSTSQRPKMAYTPTMRPTSKSSRQTLGSRTRSRPRA